VHHSPGGHWLLKEHTLTHAPVAVSHTSPLWSDPSQSTLVWHTVQAPVDVQVGAAFEHESALELPKSPAQGPQVLVDGLHAGICPVQVDVLLDVQATHSLVVGEHAGSAGLVQSVSVEHGSHVPELGPCEGHAPERHCIGLVHIPPEPMPHSLSVVSHAPARHARAPMVVVHVPPGTG
jgi:hypothetical protein